MKKFAIAIMLLLPFCALAQEPQIADEKASKDLRKALDEEIENMTINFDLADWQVFYVDSIYTHNFTVRYLEVEELTKKKVSGMDAYQVSNDKCMEANYQALKKIFNEEQWAKYEKQGAGKEKKARDKRIEKYNKK